MQKKFCGNKAKPLVNVFDLKPPKLPLPLTKSYILKCGIDECVWKFMVQNRGGWQNLLRFVKKYSYPTLYINTVFALPFFLSASIPPATKSIYKNISSSFGDRQWSFLASVCDKIVDSLIFKLHHSCVKHAVISQTWPLHIRCRYLSKIQTAVTASARPGTRMAARGSPPDSPSPRWPTGPFCGCNYKEKKIIYVRAHNKRAPSSVPGPGGSVRMFKIVSPGTCRLHTWEGENSFGWTELNCRVPSHYQAPSCFSATF